MEGISDIAGLAVQAIGKIDFDTVETQIMFDESGKIASIMPRERTISHRIIEECMLAANVCAANFLKRNGMPTLYRVHAQPPEEKLSALRDFLSELGLTCRRSVRPQPAKTPTQNPSLPAPRAPRERHVQPQLDA